MQLFEKDERVGITCDDCEANLYVIFIPSSQGYVLIHPNFVM